MKSQKRKPPNAGKGRVKGVPNKVTADVRAAVSLVAQGFVDECLALLRKGAKKDPLGAVRTFAGLLEYHIPKLSRTEVTGPNGGPMQITRKYFGKQPPTETGAKR